MITNSAVLSDFSCSHLKIQEGARSTDQAGDRMSEQQMIDNVKQSVQQCQQKAETMLNKYEAVVVEAKKDPAGSNWPGDTIPKSSQHT